MLWVQQKQRQGEIIIGKVGTKYNPADIMTKVVPIEVMWRHIVHLGFETRNGRAESAVALVDEEVVENSSSGSKEKFKKDEKDKKAPQHQIMTKIEKLSRIQCVKQLKSVRQGGAHEVRYTMSPRPVQF